MNKKALKALMVLQGDSSTSLAKEIGITPQTFCRKINEKNGAEFNLREIEVIKSKYKLNADQLTDIFFSEDVSN